MNDYGTKQLVNDIRGLVNERGAESAMFVGHDWGGTAAWATAMSHPEVVDRLAILNAAHPRKPSQGLHHPGQLRKSWYFFFFDLPGLPESVVHANNWHFFRHFLEDAQPTYTQEEMNRYIEAWSQPGAATGMINYYRSSVRQSPKQASSHWVRHDAAEQVNQLLIEFLAPSEATRDGDGSAGTTAQVASDGRQGKHCSTRPRHPSPGIATGEPEYRRRGARSTINQPHSPTGMGLGRAG